MKRALIAASIALFAGASHAYTLTFDPQANNCTGNSNGTPAGDPACSTNGLYILETYGDVPGVVDVTYSQPDQQTFQTLRWWNADYNELLGVLWADGGDGPASHARIELQALGGPLTLTHLDLGAYSHATLGTHLTIWDLANVDKPLSTPLFQYNGDVGVNSHTPPADHSNSFDFAFVSAAGFRIDWQNSAYNVGIDNVTFDAAAVIPEPETYAMFMAGLALLGFVAKRRTGRAAV